MFYGRSFIYKNIPSEIYGLYIMDIDTNAISSSMGSSSMEIKEKKIFRKATSRVWNNDKVEFLKENYNKLSYQEIANKLNLSYAAISHKACRLKLDSRDLWTEQENIIIKDNYLIYKLLFFAFPFFFVIFLIVVAVLSFTYPICRYFLH